MEAILNYGSFIALLMLSAAVVTQMAKIHARKSSEDISLLTIGIRFVAMTIILFKMIYIKDWYLTSGQLVLMITYIFYALVVLKYKYKKT